MRLTALETRINVIERHGPRDVEITGVAYDSRSVKPGSAFFAYSGGHVDGHAFIQTAVDSGALAIVHAQELTEYRDGVAYLRVRDPRGALSPVSSAFYGDPSLGLTCVGVTGTDGKSSTSYYIGQLLTALGHRTGLLTTVSLDTGRGLEPNTMRKSTPDAPEIHALLREMVDRGMTHAVIEATSHGLSRRNNRLGDVRFTAGVFTNLSHEHIEFHGSFEQYRFDKANLFRALDAVDGSFGVVNADDPNGRYFAEATRRPVFSWGSNPAADLVVSDVRTAGRGYAFRLTFEGTVHETILDVPGRFNVENAAAALLTVHGLTGESLGTLVDLTRVLIPPEGRMYTVDRGQPFGVVVDYAHSPGSFEKILPLMRESVHGRLIVLFGSGGERDTEKRPLQGEIAGRWADIVILADEDPRGEDREKILEDIAAGCRGKTRGTDLFLIADRREAIRQAFSMAAEGDLVMLLGKGHESTIQYAGGSVPWKDGSVAEECLRELGYD